jgi:hypothetical protein
MKTFNLPLEEGKPLSIADFKLYLQSTPPSIQQRVINSVDKYILAQSKCFKITYNDAPVDEGYLNICVCRFSTGKYRLHMFGKINGHEIQREKEIVDHHNHGFGLLYEKIKYVLLQSRNILKTYYNNSNIKSLEDHLLAFLLPL